jgi:2-amino-4-hydroxy-6-hydroxymethyldihydropteridine diphosphokinase
MPQTREAILSLGSNQGDRLSWLKQAGLALLALPRTRLAALSPVYESDPVGVPDACRHLPFLNCVAVLETSLDPHALMAALSAIEAGLGRTRGGAAGLPRTLDIDIVALGGLTLDTPGLTLPHPRARQRRFVLQPLADLRPDFAFPGDASTVSDLLRGLPPEPRVWRFDGSSSTV